MGTLDPIVILFIGICGIMLLWVLFKDYLIAIGLRALVGTLMITFINILVPVSAQVGINVITILCSGILGIPGVGMLYLIGIFI